MLEALTLFLSTLTLILQRRDRAKDQVGFNEDRLYAALLDLHQAAITWYRLAERTNETARHWIHSGMPQDVPDAFFAAPHEQGVAINRVDTYIRQQSRQLPDVPSDELQKVLAVYAPDVAKRLPRILADRKQFLENYMSELQRLRTTSPQAAQDLIDVLSQQLTDLDGAIAGLEELIRGMRPIPRTPQ